MVGFLARMFSGAPAVELPRLTMETGCGEPIYDPSAERIAVELAGLDGGENSFAILARGQMTYIQTAGSVRDGFVLEYQNGSLDRNYTSKHKDLPLETVTTVFQLYADENPSWLPLVDWE